MNVSWLIEPDLFPDYAEALAAAARAEGHQAEFVPELPIQYRWDDVGSYYRRVFPKGACVVFHGSIALATRIANDALWHPGAWFTRENFDCSVYYCHFAQFLLNADYVMLPFGELRRRKEFLFNQFGIDGAIFVRPDSVAKSFTGQCAGWDTFDKDVEFMAFYDVPPNAIVLVSSPKRVVEEWRFVIAEHQVVAGSLYKTNGEMQISKEVHPLAQKLATEVASETFQPDRVWTADICRTADERFWLLEIGSFSCANLYSCDPTSIVRAVSPIAKCEWNERVQFAT